MMAQPTEGPSTSGGMLFSFDPFVPVPKRRGQLPWNNKTIRAAIKDYKYRGSLQGRWNDMPEQQRERLVQAFARG
jgi:hypothetical protein